MEIVIQFIQKRNFTNGSWCSPSHCCWLQLCYFSNILYTVADSCKIRASECKKFGSSEGILFFIGKLNTPPISYNLIGTSSSHNNGMEGEVGDSIFFFFFDNVGNLSKEPFGLAPLGKKTYRQLTAPTKTSFRVGHL